MQIVDFSLKAVAKSKEIYKEGSISQYEELENITKQLADLQIDLNPPTTAGTETPGDKKLLEVAEKCSKSAEQLVAKLGPLKRKGPQKKREAVKKTIKALWEKGEIELYQKQLEGCQRLFDTQMLLDLRRRLELVIPKQSHGFEGLDQKSQELINILSEHPEMFGDLLNIVQCKLERNTDNVSAESQRLKQQRANEKCRARLLESLRFGEIHSRQESIVAAHAKTFRWIFGPSAQIVVKWDNFVQWLESGQGVYWIYGKAGSGKSTLMNFLCQHERTTLSLRVWSGVKELLVPNFFFWSAGSSMEKSIEGLLRSLIWQILSSQPAGMPLLQSPQTPIELWTEGRLRQTLQDVLRQVSVDHRLCLFIDGLDEFEGQQDELIHLMLVIAQKTEVKVCLSSRPSRAFHRFFGAYPKLRLQDLTQKDIQEFVSDKLRNVSPIRPDVAQHSLWLENTERSIVARAAGVFLWVSLAVKDQIRGLKNGEISKQLEERLELLPDEIEGVYTRMLNSIGNSNRREASRFLQVAVHIPRISVTGIALMCYSGLDQMIESPGGIARHEVATISRLAWERIDLTCGGLLEIQADRLSEDTPPRYDDWHLPVSIVDCLNLRGEAFNKVHLVHRTALDFMTKTGQGSHFTKANMTPGFDLQDSYAKLLILQLQLFGKSLCAEHWVHVRIGNIMQAIISIDENSGIPQTRLYELTHHTMYNIDRRYQTKQHRNGKRQDEEGHDCIRDKGCHSCEQINWNLDAAWCMRWGTLSMSSRYRDKSPQSPSLNSRSSSQDSFHSVGSQPRVSNATIAIPERALNFLSYAASEGSSLYVQQTLDHLKNHIGPRAATNLLCCSLTLRFEDRFVGTCLKRAADLNARTDVDRFNDTIWQTYLQLIESNVRATEKPNLAPYMKKALAFIENGADVHAIIGALQSYDIWSDRWLSYGEGSGPYGRKRTYRKCSSYVELSALAVMQLRLGDQPEFPRVRTICVENEAQFYYRCTYLESQDTAALADAPKKRYSLSEQESTTFLELVETYLDFHSSAPRHRESNDQFAQFCITLDRESRQEGAWADAFRAFKKRERVLVTPQLHNFRCRCGARAEDESGWWP